MELKLQKERIYSIQNEPISNGVVVYWMSREQRINDNWSLIYAQQIAEITNSKLLVLVCIVEDFLDAEPRNVRFMIDGLKSLKETLNKLNIPLALLKGKSEVEIPKFLNSFDKLHIITDFDPLKIKRNWQNLIFESLKCNFEIVDSHNIVPCKFVSDKQEFGAYTLRPKIQKLLDNFIIEFPSIDYHQLNDNLFFYQYNKCDFPEITSRIDIDWINGGEDYALRMLKDFINDKLDKYFEFKNSPKHEVVSNLSPYLHFGHISAQRIALEVIKANKNKESTDSFLEELIVRKELADNFCYYNPNYDCFDGFPEWAQITLSEHIKDKRPYLYSLDVFENYKTNDKLWNFAQKQMVTEGKMHGYLRMYWAKKILEWTSTPEIAMKYAIYLNNKYELDGRDANSYAGIAWSIGGVHDRPWAERAIFGKVRYMSYNSQIKKVDFNENKGLFNY